MNYQNLAFRGAKMLQNLLLQSLMRRRKSFAFIATVHTLLRSAQMVSSNNRTLRPHLLYGSDLGHAPADRASSRVQSKRTLVFLTDKQFSRPYK